MGFNNTKDKHIEKSRSDSCHVDDPMLGGVDNSEAQDKPLEYVVEDRDIIKEVESLNQQMRDQHVYQKTKYWHQQSSEINGFDQSEQLREITERLTRIEEKLDGIDKKLQL